MIVAGTTTTFQLTAEACIHGLVGKKEKTKARVRNASENMLMMIPRTRPKWYCEVGSLPPESLRQSKTATAIQYDSSMQLVAVVEMYCHAASEPMTTRIIRDDRSAVAMMLLRGTAEPGPT